MTMTAHEARTGVPPASTAPLRLAIFTTHPIQYQAPLFRELASRPDIIPTVFFGSRHGLDVSLDKGFGATFQWDIPLLEGYDHRFLDNVAAKPDVARFTGLRVRGIEEELARGGFDVCLTLGWGTIAHLQFMRAARRLGIPLWVRGESNLRRQPVGGIRGVARSMLWLPLRRIIYSRMFSGVDGFLVIGSRNREFYRAFGVPDSKLHMALYGVENERFALPPGERAKARARRRSENGIPSDAVVFVSSGKLLERKRPFDLLDAFARSRDTSVETHLVFLGDGPERAALEARIARMGLAARVTITGFVNQSAIPEWYAASDCLVLPSDNRETWGLVANEAMAARLPIIVSDAVGCAPDLVQEGTNGYTYPFADVDALADRMRRIASAGAPRRDEMGAMSLKLVNDASFGTLAGALMTRLRPGVK